jgi:hypothetical protein
VALEPVEQAGVVVSQVIGRYRLGYRLHRHIEGGDDDVHALPRPELPAHAHDLPPLQVAHEQLRHGGVPEAVEGLSEHDRADLVDRHVPLQSEESALADSVGIHPDPDAEVRESRERHRDRCEDLGDQHREPGSVGSGEEVEHHEHGGEEGETGEHSLPQQMRMRAQQSPRHVRPPE